MILMLLMMYKKGRTKQNIYLHIRMMKLQFNYILNCGYGTDEEKYIWC